MDDETISETIDESPIEPDAAIEGTAPIRSVAADGLRDGSVALVAGASILVAAARSLFRGRLRAVPQAMIGAALVRVGLRQRGGAEETIDEQLLGGAGGGEPGSDDRLDVDADVPEETESAIHDAPDADAEADADDPFEDEL